MLGSCGVFIVFLLVVVVIVREVFNSVGSCTFFVLWGI